MDMSSREYEIIDVRQSLARTGEDLTPSLKQIYELWLELAGDRFAPSWKDFRIDILPAKQIPWTLVLDVVDGGEDFRYRFWSAERATMRGVEYTGQLVSRYGTPEFREKIMSEYREVVAKREPVVFTTRVRLPIEFTGDADDHHFYSLLRMPVSYDGETIDRIYAFDALEYVYDWQYRFRRWDEDYHGGLSGPLRGA